MSESRKHKLYPKWYSPDFGSRSRVSGLKHLSAFHVPDTFDPDELSWITSGVAITDWEGGVEASKSGYFVVNVAGELTEAPCNAFIPVEPFEGAKKTLKMVSEVADLIDEKVREGHQVVVHCAMGMERSVLCVVWYLHLHMGMTVDEAYNWIGPIRPIAADRRDWIGIKTENADTDMG